MIVGGGPVGLTLSILLSKFGVDSQLVERRTTPTTHPQAHFINNRSREIFRGMRGLDAAVTKAQPPLADWRHFIYATRMLGGVELGRVDHFRENSGEGVCQRSVSPTSVAHLSQHKLEPMLFQRAVASHPRGLGGFSLGMQCVGVSQERVGVSQVGNTVTAEVRTVTHATDGDSGDSGETSFSAQRSRASKIKCKHLVAADGANGGVRSWLRIGNSGTADMQHLVNVHFTSQALADALRKENNSAMLHFVFNPAVIAVVVSHSGDEFVAQLPFFPPLQTLREDFSFAQCLELVRSAVGSVPRSSVGNSVADGNAAAKFGDSTTRAATIDDLRIESVREWKMSALVADKFHDGNIFLAGDAAHSFPPAGGFGMNTGIQDAHALAWRIAAWHLGNESDKNCSKDSSSSDRDSDDGHLESIGKAYTRERRPVAVRNARVSVGNFRNVLKVPAAIGLDPRAANALQQLTNVSNFLSDSLLSQLSPEVHKASRDAQRKALSMSLALGRSQCGQLLESDNVLGNARRAEVAKLCASDSDTLRLQFPDVDLGFVYDVDGVGDEDGEKNSRPFVDDTSKNTKANRDDDDAKIVGPSAKLAAPGTLFLGARVPHVWVSLGDVGGVGGVARVSTLDLVEPVLRDAGDDRVIELIELGDDESGSEKNHLLDLGSEKNQNQKHEPSAPTFAVLVSVPENDDGNHFDFEGKAEALIERVRLEGPGHVRLRLVLVSRPEEKTKESKKSKEKEKESKTNPATSLTVLAVDPAGSWKSLVGTNSVLVRPDGHVGWIGKLDGKGISGLAAALRRALGRR